MRKQRLPKDFWTFLTPNDKNTYCFWYQNGTLKKHIMHDVNEARAFIDRAKEKHVAAFASAYIEQENENQIFTCSFEAELKQYETKDGIQLEINGANYKLLNYPLKKAELQANKRNTEQWEHKNYDIKYNNAKYFVSWYDTVLHKFDGQEFITLDIADKFFEEKKNSDIPVRLTEYKESMKQIHEIKAACQHWHIGIGRYLEQAAAKTLPIGEIPYIFTNNLLKSEMQIYGKYGFLDFDIGFNQYQIQIGSFLNGASINIQTIDGEVIYHINIDDNPIINPWLTHIERWSK